MAEAEGRGDDGQASAGDWAGSPYDRLRQRILPGKPLNADVIAGGIKAEEARIREMRHDFEWLLIDARGGAKTASAAASGALAARPVEVVVIGGGVRLDPAQTSVLEALVNAVIEAGPGARVAFSTSPTDTAAAIDRV